MENNSPLRYLDKPLEAMTVAELTDAVGIANAAKLLGVSARNIYTVRNTNHLGTERIQKLIAEIRKNETHCRERLVIIHTQRVRHAAKRAV